MADWLHLVASPACAVHAGTALLTASFLPAGVFADAADRCSKGVKTPIDLATWAGVAAVEVTQAAAALHSKQQEQQQHSRPGSRQGLQQAQQVMMPSEQQLSSIVRCAHAVLRYLQQDGDPEWPRCCGRSTGSQKQT
jgi:hypothetical protein